MSNSSSLKQWRLKVAAATVTTALLTACTDRTPGQVCAAEFEVTSYHPSCPTCGGVRLLVVVDTSSTMAKAQEKLAEALFDLVDLLVNPAPDDDPEIDYPGPESLTVQFISADLGLQWGEGNPYDGPDVDAPSCSAVGDDARPLMPEGCSPSQDPWIELKSLDDRLEAPEQVACGAGLGTGGCGISQALEAAVRAHAAPLGEVTAVIVVSDKDDCSIRSSELFETSAWQTAARDSLYTACHYPEDNEAYLYSPSELATLLAKKTPWPSETYFLAFVGVPDEAGSPCQGEGDELDPERCLADERMRSRLVSRKTPEGGVVEGLAWACTEVSDGESDPIFAAPGRRFVEMAGYFGVRGAVYSICSPDWTPAMRHLAGRLGARAGEVCWSQKEPWALLPKSEREKMGCEGCGTPGCDLVVEISRTADDMEDETCPAGLYDHLDDAQRADLERRRDVVEMQRDGVVKSKTIRCPLPKLATPLECTEAKGYVHDHYQGHPGWYYCENALENNDERCRDDMDNDRDALTDCDDADCSGCPSCGGAGLSCDAGCSREVLLTDRTKDLVKGHFVVHQCLAPSDAHDANCKERR
jgi:hypothetical protein